MLSEPHAGRSQENGDAIQELLVKGELPMLVFTADDLDATFEKVRVVGCRGAAGADRHGLGSRLRVP